MAVVSSDSTGALRGAGRARIRRSGKIAEKMIHIKAERPAGA